MSAFVSLELYRAMLDGRTPPGVHERVAALYRSASEQGAIGEGDALLIGDLQALSGYTGLDEASLPLHALLILMFDALGDGSLCLSLDETRLRARAQVLGEQGEDLAALALRKLAEWPELIGSENEFKPLILRTHSTERLLYFQRWFDCERRLESELKRLLAAPAPDLPGDKKLKTVFQAVLETNPAGGAQSPLNLEFWQRAALGIATLNDFSILSGGPGTGKTTLVATLLRCLVRLGIGAEEIRLAAPTGRAAARMTESIRRTAASVASKNANDSALLKLEAQTLHRLLVYRPSRNDFLHSATNPLEGRVLIIDEVSMVDAAMMARVLEAVPAGMRVVLVGDREQLPSVEAGAVLADILPRSFENGVTAELSTRLSSLLDISLPKVATASAIHDHAVVLMAHQRVSKQLQPIVNAVREGRGEPLFEAALWKFGMLDWPSPAQETAYRWFDLSNPREVWRLVLTEWRRRIWNAVLKSQLQAIQPLLDFSEHAPAPSTAACKALAELFEHLQRGQILTLARSGPFGCERINAVLFDAVRSELDPRSPHNYFHGLPLLITRNNYTHRLFNGDVGLVLADEAGRYRAVFPHTNTDEGERAQRAYQFLPVDVLAGGWEAAFAMTVHKSQGSEYDEVLLVVPPLRDGGAAERAPRMQRLLTREILYTGITRARNAATLCGTKDAIELALARRMERVSGLELPRPTPGVKPGWLF